MQLPVAPPHPTLALGAHVDLPMLVVDLERRDSRRGEFTTLTLAHRSERISTSRSAAPETLMIVTRAG